MSAAPEDGGDGEPFRSVTRCAEGDKGMVERVDKDLQTGTNGSRAMLADDQISKHQSGLQHGGSIGMQRKSEEQEPQTYRASSTSFRKDIRADATRREFQGLIDTATFTLAAPFAVRRPIIAN